MGRYVGNKWREDLPSLSSADQQQGNNVPVSSGGGGGGSPTSGGGGSPPTQATSAYGPSQGNWTTVNGQRTIPQMAAELASVGYNGPTDAGSVLAAYQRTTGGAVSAGTPTVAGSTSTIPVAPAPPAVAPGTFTNPTANRDVLNAAQQAAYQAYLNAKLNLDTEDLAFKKAQDAFSRTIQEAGLTGTYNGAPTMAAQQQKFAQDTSVAALLGTYNGQPTLAAQQQQANITGYDAQGRPTLARQGQEQQTAQQYLSLIGGLRGPADPFQYLRTLQGTPQGIKSVVDAAAGRYIMGSAASGEVAPRATLGSLVGTATGPAPGTPDLSGLPLSNQIDPQNYARMLPSQKAALWAAYEYGGPTGAMRPEDAQASFLQSLPRYTYSPGVAGTVKM